MPFSIGNVLFSLAIWMSASGSSAQFPVSRAEAEFVPLVPYVQGYCGAIKADEEAFRRAVLPFGPLDLSISKGSPEDVEVLRNFYLGIAGRACGIDAAALAKSFHCGPSCTDARRSELREKIAPIKQLVSDFINLKGVGVVSQWGVVGEYRIDNMFAMMNQMKETKPSPMMGFVPSESWTDLSDLSEYLKRRGVSEKAFDLVLREIKQLSLAAVVRERGWIRVVRVGIADNESGLIFLPIGTTRPKVGQKTRGGGEYVLVQELEKGIYFYETN